MSGAATARRVLVVGSANVDFTVAASRLPGVGETVSGGTLLVNHGGKGANQAVAARRLGADRWGSTMEESSDVLADLHRLIETEFPGWDPYPWGARYQSDDLIRHILFAQALLPEYAELFRGLGDEELIALADSFLLEQCVRREPLIELLADNLAQ